MTTQRIQTVILCEDQQHGVFLRWLLIYKGFHKRTIRINMCPKGKQAGEQYVRENYPIEVASFRSKNYLRGALITVIDADTLSHAARVRQLDVSLKQNKLYPRKETEPIILAIPKRNIETWIHFLMDKPVNEDEVYDKLPKESTWKASVKQLATRTELPQEAPSSLHKFRDELTRLDPFIDRDTP